MKTDVAAFIQDLDAGVFEGKLAEILSKVAAATIDCERKGTVTLTFGFQRIGNSYQVDVSHTLAYKQPTARGEATEKEVTSTPMHVGKGGRLSLFAEHHGQLFDKHGEARPHMPNQSHIEDND